MAESEELKSLLMKVKEESERVGLKLYIQKTKIMSSGPITSWQIEGDTVETVVDFIFLGSKITADGDCSREIKRHLFLGKKVMTNLAATATAAKSLQLCPTLCDPIEGSPPGSSTHGIIQARVLEWVAISLGIFLTQASNPGLLHCRQTLLQASFNFMAAVTICSDFGTPKINPLSVSIVSPSICHEVMGPDAMILVF